jgi:hypothetical protein
MMNDGVRLSRALSRVWRIWRSNSAVFACMTLRDGTYADSKTARAKSLSVELDEFIA